MRQLGGEDFHNLTDERPNETHNTVKVLRLDRTVAVDVVRAHVRGRLAALPSLSGVAVWSPFRLGRPAWVRAEPDLDAHVRGVTAAPPGGERELAALVERAASDH